MFVLLTYLLTTAYIIETSTPTPAHSSRNKKAQLSLTNPTRRESMPKIAPIPCAYNVVAVNIFIRLAVVASEICEIPRNSLKIETYRVQGHPRLSILVPIESAYVLSY